MKIKILVPIICMLLISTVIPVAGIVNQNNPNNYQFDNKDNFLPSESDLDWWAMFRHDSANTGCSSCIAPDTNELCWQQTISDMAGINAPIVAEDKLYLSTGGVYNLEPPEQGELQIKPINEEPALYSIVPKIISKINDQYYGSLYCLDAVNGTSLWDIYVGWSQNPAVVDGKVYFTMADFYSYNSQVQCRDAETGQTINWQRTLPGWILSSVIVADDKVYVSSLDIYGYSGKLFCLNAQNGNIIWTYTMPPMEFMLYSSAAVADGKVYFVTSSFYYYYGGGSLYCLDAETGAYQWDQPVGYSELCSPVVADGRVYVNIFDWYYSYSGTVSCFDADTGSPLWTYDLGYYQIVISNPAFYDGSIYVAVMDYSFYNGRIYRIDAETGDVIWNIQTSGFPYYSSPSIADDKLYITVVNFYGYDGKLICLDTADGNLIWEYMLDFFSMSSPAIADGRVYIPDYFGNIYSVGYPNEPPTTPSISGETNGKAGKSYEYTLVSTDPEEEDIYYFVYWGDDNSTGWIGPYDSGEMVTVNHSWEIKDTYNITAQAKDTHGTKSDWATLEVTMPASKQTTKSNMQNFLENLIQRFPMLERICILYTQFYKYFFNKEE